MYDLIVIGAGPGGYVSAERAGAKGLKTLIVEKSHLGGVCLNCGCIPTKTLLNSAKKYKQAKSSEGFGVFTDNARLDYPKAMEWKRSVIEKNRVGVAYQMKRHKVDVVSGEARFLSPRKIEVGGDIYEGEKIIIATGSRPFVPLIPGADNPKVLTSTDLLELEEVPERLIVIGGGVIGLEFASLFSTLGSEVHVVEMLDTIVPNMDAEIGKMLQRSLSGVKFHLGAKVESIDGGKVNFVQKGEEKSLEGDYVLMSVGRRSNVQGMDFEKIGLDFDGRGIKVNEYMQTNLPGVYAVGDVTGKSLLAHSAYRMGEVAVNHICSKKDRMRYDAIPWVVYTSPEAAGVGLSENEAREKGFDIEIATLPMRANGRFLAEHGNEPGICKIIVDKKHNIVLGVHMLGNGTSELIAGATVMMEAELRVDDIREIVFPHPTLSEIIKDTLWELH